MPINNRCKFDINGLPLLYRYTGIWLSVQIVLNVVGTEYRLHIFELQVLNCRAKLKHLALLKNVFQFHFQYCVTKLLDIFTKN